MKDRLIINLKDVQIRWFIEDGNYTDENREGFMEDVALAPDLDDSGRESTLRRRVRTNIRRSYQVTDGDQQVGHFEWKKFEEMKWGIG